MKGFETAVFFMIKKTHLPFTADSAAAESFFYDIKHWHETMLTLW